MMLKRNLLGWRCEEYWFDEAGYLASTADIAALRSHASARACDCSIPERTLLVPLDRAPEAILAAFDTRAKTSIRQAAKTVRVDVAASPEERELFYAAYRPFAAERGLLIPDAKEEAELDILLARNLAGELLQAAAFLPAKAAGVYRYRYGVYVRKSQANAALGWHERAARLLEARLPVEHPLRLRNALYIQLAAWRATPDAAAEAAWRRQALDYAGRYAPGSSWPVAIEQALQGPSCTAASGANCALFL